MLSRVAESLYWMARYIERAEAVSRLAVVNFQAQLDGAHSGGWDDVVSITSDPELYRGLCEAQERDDEGSALRFLFTHPSNPNGVLATLSRARENARAIRDQVSSEVWEHLNRLYLLARDGTAGALAGEPYAFFRQVRDGSQAFEGITAATMTHGEAYQFMQLGRYLERAVTTVRTLAVRYQEVRSFEDGTAQSSLGLMTLLKSCGAFEPYRRQHATQLQARLVAEYLLLSPLFPRAVLFCLERASRSVSAISPAPARGSADRLDAPARLLGRLQADLSYLDTGDALEEGLPLLLEHLVRKIHQVGNEITRSYFNARVILPSTTGGPPIQQQQQQQQQLRTEASA
jgi:uncharacterized alpha-E superfamily protein